MKKDAYQTKVREAAEMEKKQAAHIENQYNAPVNISRDMNTGHDATITNNVSEGKPDTKWFQKEIVKMILSFICGVATTIVAQLILKEWGLI